MKRFALCFLALGAFAFAADESPNVASPASAAAPVEITAEPTAESANAEANAANPATNPDANPVARPTANPAVNLAPNPPTANTAISADEKLKNEIITFDRQKNNMEISDPFIYVYPQSEEELALFLKIEQATLVLNGIFDNKASINNNWYAKDDVVEGWTVAAVKNDRVELKFKNKERTLYVFTNNNNIKIK